MFGKAFNTTKFNNNISTFDILIDFRAFENILNSTHLGKELSFDDVAFSFTEQVSSTAFIGGGIPFSCEFNEAVSAEISILGNVRVIVFFNETVSVVFSMVKGISPKLTFNEAIFSMISLGKDVHHLLTFTEDVQSRTILVKNISQSLVFTEIMNALISVFNLSEESMILDVNVRPGETVLIDTANYVATLNMRNVLHLAHGDFITVSREVVDLILDSGNGARLEGKIFFIERYL